MNSSTPDRPSYRILFPTGSFYPAQTGGPDNTVYWITKALTRRGHQPQISTTDRGQPSTTPVGKWLTTDYGQVIYTRNPIHYLPLGVLKRALTKLGGADVLHLSMITYPAGFLMAIINSAYYGKPMLWSSRGDLDPPMLLRSAGRKRFVLWLIRTFVRKRLLTFHSTCDAETRYIRDNFGQQAKVIQIPNYMELPARVDVPKEKYILYIGRIDPKKAIENLLTALDGSEKFRASEFRLKVAGDHNSDYGRELIRQSIAAGLTDQVEFVGHVSGNRKEELLAGAWFAIMPSHTENFGIVVMEAMAQGTPAIASTGTPWSQLPVHDAGYWVDNDSESLRRVVDEVISLPTERVREMSANALRLAREEFSIHANVAEWEAAYATIVNE